MNSLSWLIYLSDVIPSIKGFFEFIGVIFLIGVVCTVFFALVVFEKPLTSFKKYVTYIVVTVLISFFVSVIMPSQKTILMIAASEFGENIVEKNQLVDPTLEYIRKTIQKKIEELDNPSNKGK